MAGDWIPAATDLARKPKVLAFARASGICRHTAAGLLIDFWGYVSEESTEGFIADIVLEDLPTILGGPSSFWQAVSAAGWIVVKEDGLLVPDNQDHPWLAKGAKARLLNARRQTAHRVTQARDIRNAPPLRNITHPPLPQKEKEKETNTDISDQSDQSDFLDLVYGEALPFASRLYRATGSTKDNDPFLWQIAVLGANGVLSEDSINRAAEQCGKATSNRVAYFRRTLERIIGGKPELKQLIAKVRLTRDFPRSPPGSGYGFDASPEAFQGLQT